MDEGNSTLPCILTISANSELKLDSLVADLHSFVKSNAGRDNLTLPEIAFCLNQNSNGEDNIHRAFLIARNETEVLEKLEKEDYIRGSCGTPRRKLCFLFPGYSTEQGSIETGVELIRNLQDYRTFYEKIRNTFFKNEKDEKDFEMPGLLKTALISDTLSNVWEKWGISSDIVLGHSMGEYVAAMKAGIHSQEEGLNLIEFAGELRRKSEEGGMVVVLADPGTVSRLIASYSGSWLEIAGENTPTQVVVGGSPEGVKWLITECQKRGIVAEKLPLEMAFHCRGVEPALPALIDFAQEIKYRKPSCTFISSKTGEVVGSEGITKEYWPSHLREKVRFIKAATTAWREGADVFLECGKGNNISSMVLQSIEPLFSTSQRSQPIFLSSIPESSNEIEGLLTTLGHLFLLGFNPNWKSVFANYFNTDFVGKAVNLPFLKEMTMCSSHNATTQLVNREGTHSIMKIENDAEFLRKLECSSEKEMEELFLALVNKMVKELAKVSEEEILKDADFREIGMDSFRLVKMKGYFQHLLGPGKCFGINGLLDCRTPSQLAKKLTKVYTQLEDLEEEEREREIYKQLIAADSILWPHISAGSVPPIHPGEITTYLFTGVTGHLGPHILTEISKRRETKFVFCLIRARKGEESPQERLLKHLGKHELLPDKVDMSKVIAISGDIVQERMGLSVEEYRRLSHLIECIINCAAVTNHLVPYVKEDTKYAGVRAVNVIGTQRILEFAGTGRTKHVLAASTILAVFHPEFRTIDFDKMPEDWPEKFVDKLPKLPNVGYFVSKVISDSLLHQATDKGIPVKCFRFGKVGGSRKTGNIKVFEDHFFAKFLHYIIFGLAPDIPIPLVEMTVETCAEIAVKIFFHPDAKESDIYNVVPPYSRDELDISELADELGVKLRVLTVAGNILGSNAMSTIIPDHASKWTEFLIENAIHISAGWMEKPETVFGNEMLMSFLSHYFFGPVKILPWPEYKHELESRGQDSLVSTWLEFYTSKQSFFQLAFDKQLRVIDNWADNKNTFLRDGKIEKLLPDLKEFVEDPLEVVKKQIQYVLKHPVDAFERY